jgi:hypothetical protein
MIPNRQSERGAVLGIVLVLLLIILVGGGLAMWGLRSEMSSAGSDRLERQLFDCAEQGLSWGKQFFSTQALDWTGYFRSNNQCTAGVFPCPPFQTPTINVQTPLVLGGYPSGQGRYPDQFPFTQQITGVTTITNAELWVSVGVYDNQDETGGTNDPTTDVDSQAFVYSRCIDKRTGEARAVQSLIQIKPPNADYNTQSGYGSRNQGNAN